MDKALLIMFILGTLFVSACSNVQKENDNIVPVKDKKVILDSSPKEALLKLEELKKLSEQSYLVADANTRMVEMRGKEMAKLKEYRLQVEQEGEELVSVQKKQIEEEYQLRMFNLRMQLDSLKMRSKNREQLEYEIEDLRYEREAKLMIADERKADYVNSKMKAYREAMQKRLNAEANRLPLKY